MTRRLCRTLWVSAGPLYLVAPQFARLNESGTSREVYLPMLPAREMWVDEFTNESHSGGQVVTVATPLDRFGLFRRSAANATTSS